MNNFDYDRSGKIVLDDVYNQPDPTAYFATLQELGYRIPGEAKPVFRRLIEARRAVTGEATTKVIDVGCSYGVNAALLRHDVSMDDLYRLYGEELPATPEALAARDAGLFADPDDAALEVVGVDVADRAIAYAVQAGVLDAGVSANLEVADPDARNAAVLEDADMVISTGCIGYVSEASMERIVAPSIARQPWMANFVLRMFDYEPIETMMARHDYVTEKLEGALFPQRRFASADERDHVLDNLARIGVPADGAEAEGWYVAELYVSRPRAHARAAPLDGILEGLSIPIGVAPAVPA